MNGNHDHQNIPLAKHYAFSCYSIMLVGDVIEVSPAANVDDEMANLIKMYKAN